MIRILEVLHLDFWQGDSAIDIDEVVSATRRWLEKSVIGLNLCPFAEQPYRAGRVRFCVSQQRSPSGLLEDLCSELHALAAAQPSQCETALLIHPLVLTDFLEYNDFLEVCDAALVELHLEGELQVASFHPQYQFAGTSPTDIENCTNRSPYPMLHLLREASVARAVAAVDDSGEIYRRNIRTLRDLGADGWRRLWCD
ncbi:MAG TPA: DUF1415 domain-containing protein [Steroidobacteraceae bacterium]